jgi:FixJ family two-component response regulator
MVGVDMPRADDDAGVVYIIDDDVSLCVALKELFNSIGLIAETHGSAREFLNGDLTDFPACIVIDVRLPDVNGLQFQNQLVQMGIRIPVVMMTGHGDILMSVRAMKAGAVDFLAKPFSHQALLDAVLSALERDRQRRVNEQSAAQIKKQFETLSPRERQVMLLVTAGKMNKQVAGELGISEVTTKIHRASATRKMGAHTFAELVRMADALKLFDP